jgi:hypothetical protein
MYKVKEKGHTVRKEQHVLIFPLVGDKGSSYTFDCDQYGVIQWHELSGEAAKENFRKCLVGEHNVERPYMDIYKSSYWSPTIIECHCGNEVHCESFTNECYKCHRDYSSSGQLLAPRSQWGEETGESAADILNYDYINCPEVDY